jgi:peptidoglycan/xylan/chitin deacetylase (PgdA/CDA1 family)
VGVTGVQFKLDGNNLGPVLTTAPYMYTWDTSAVSNGLHTLTAVASNAASLTTTSTSVSVNVSNTVVTPPTPPAGNTGPNLIPNPSVETASGTAPASWLSSNWGTNTSTFSYLTTGHTGSHSLKVQTTAFTNGAANWYYADVPVTAGTTYQYTNWYQANVDTEVDAEVTMSDGSVQYFYLGTVLANTSWTQFKTTFTAPAGAKSMAIYQILAKVGYIVTDDYTLSTYTPAPFNRAIVSVTFDDGWANQYTNARPVMKSNGLIGTYYIISGELTDQPDYMSATQVKQLFADGNEIASHSVTHPDMTTLTTAKLQSEMANSQTTLQNLIGTPVTDFAYPFGAYNGTTIAMGKQYYQSQRTVNAGYNTKDNLDLTQLKMYEVDSNITQAQVKAWIDGAIASHSWLILCYHEIATTPSDPTDDLYTTQPSDFAAEMTYLKSTGVATETVHQAINEVVPQL